MNFFRQMPNALLARYFQGQGLFDELDFAAMKEGKPKGFRVSDRDSGAAKHP